MRILLDCRYLTGGRLSGRRAGRVAGGPGPEGNGGRGFFIRSCAAVLNRDRGVEWVFLVGKGRGEVEGFPADLGPTVRVSGMIPGVAGRMIWAGWQLPGLIKKYHADRVMEAEEMMSVAGAADERFGSLTTAEKEGVKSAFADGKEYFLADLSDAGSGWVVELLKAFSLFKKRQRSNMQLVLASAGEKGQWTAGGRAVRRGDAGLKTKLATYKYRSDVHVLNSPGEEEWRRLVAAAYTFIPAAGGDPLGLAMFNAWKAETPVIRCDVATLRELGGDAVLYANAGDPSSLAALLMSLYTNEGLRAGLIREARARLGAFTWEGCAEQVWERILRKADRR